MGNDSDTTTRALCSTRTLEPVIYTDLEDLVYQLVKQMTDALCEDRMALHASRLTPGIGLGYFDFGRFLENFTMAVLLDMADTNPFIEVRGNRVRFRRSRAVHLTTQRTIEEIMAHPVFVIDVRRQLLLTAIEHSKQAAFLDLPGGKGLLGLNLCTSITDAITGGGFNVPVGQDNRAEWHVDKPRAAKGEGTCSAKRYHLRIEGVDVPDPHGVEIIYYT